MQKEPFYKLASNTLGNEERLAILKIVELGQFTMGENVANFEKKFAEYFGAKYAIMFNSGSSANLVAMSSLFYLSENQLKRGDEVIVPAISWATTYYPLQQLGLKLRFVDVDLDTLNMDISKLEQALTPKTKMVVAVSVLGNPCALDGIRTFCDDNGLIMYEDNCESMGAELNGKQCGTYGDIGAFSTFFSHHISTMEGGMIVTCNEEIFHLCKSIRNHGLTRDIPPGSIYEAHEDSFSEEYHFIVPGYNVRPLELSGAIGLEQIKKLKNFVEVRRDNASYFQSIFSNDDRFITQRENGKSSWFSFTFIINPASGIKRQKVFEALRKADIGFRMITGGCFPRHDVIKYFNYEIVDNLNNADLAHDAGFFVGNHPEKIRLQIDRLKETLDKVSGG